MEPKRERGRDGALWEARAHQFELLGDGPVSKCGVCGLLTMPSHPHKQQECWVEVEFAPGSDKALLLVSQAEVARLSARVQELERHLRRYHPKPADQSCPILHPELHVEVPDDDLV
jgi:hypothetical protein